MDQSQIKTQPPLSASGWSSSDSLRRTDNKLAVFRVSDDPIGPAAKKEVSRRVHKHVTDEEMLKWRKMSRKTGIMGTDETNRYFEVQMCETCLDRMNALETGLAIPGDNEQYRQTQAHLVAVDVRNIHLTADEIPKWPELLAVRVDHVKGCAACAKRIEQLELDRKETAKSFGRAVTEFLSGLFQ